MLDVLKIVKPETLIRWHRAGFRRYWRWKSRPRGGRPKTPAEIRQIIRQMSVANPLWGAPRIHGELLKVGIDVGQTTVAKYMVRHTHPPSQGWRTFLHNHASDLISGRDTPRSTSRPGERDYGSLTFEDIAKSDDVVASYVTRLFRLTTLAPDIVSAILSGRNSPELTARRLMDDTRLPLDWNEQRRLLGFAPGA